MDSPTGSITGIWPGVPYRLPHQGILRPPCFPDILAWHTGKVQGETLLRDLAPALGDQPLQMVDGPCLSPDGVDTFTTATDHGTIESYLGTSTLAYDGSTVTATAGTFYKLLFSDGTLYPCIGKTNSVNPTTVSATNGSVMTIISTDYAAVWAGVQQDYFWEVANGYREDAQGRYPFAKSGATFVPAGWNYPMNGFRFESDGSGLAPAAIIAMDLGTHMYTNNLGESLVWKQEVIEELGGELVENGLFTKWTDPTVPEGWTKDGTHNATNYVEESPTGALHLLSDGTSVSIYESILDIGKEYTVTFELLEYIFDGLKFRNLNDLYIVNDTNKRLGKHSFTFTAASVLFSIFRNNFVGSNDVTIDNISVREVDPVVNNNDQYFLGSIAPKPKEHIAYESVLTDPCLGQTLVRVGAAEYVMDIDDDSIVLDIDDDEKVYSEVE